MANYMPEGSEQNLTGRTCLVTGANSGIGKETARGLARMAASVVLACRNAERGEDARRDIARTTGNSNVEVMSVDLSSQESIRKFAQAFKQMHSKLHVLVNCAGIYTGRQTVTVDGFETTFAVNHLAYFLLSNLLLDLLKASAPSRIVNVTSEAQRNGRINFEDLQGEKRFSGTRAYSQSKLANVMFTHELARRLEGTGVTVNCVHPGAVRTNFGKNSGDFMSVMVRILAPFMLSPEKGAETPIYVASAPELEKVTGKYFIRKAEAKSAPESYDEDRASRLWDVSSQLTHLGN